MTQNSKVSLLLFLLTTFLLGTNWEHSFAQKNQTTTNSLSNDRVTNAVNDFSLFLSSTKFVYSPNESIMLKGNLRNGTEPVANHSVIIEASQGDKIIYRSSTITDNQGRFTDSYLSVPFEGTITITAAATSKDDKNTEVNGIVTVSVAKEKQEWLIIFPILAIGGSFACIIVPFRKILIIGKSSAIGLVGAVILTALGYFILYTYSPLDTVGNAAVAAALLAPIATYIFQTLQMRRETSSVLEDSVAEYKKTHLTEEVNSLSNILEEITVHKAIFDAKPENDTLQKKLQKSNYKKSKKTGLLANLPGLRINKYYYYVDYYNKLLEAKLKEPRLPELSNDVKYSAYCGTFEQLKYSYSQLNTVLYVTLLYNIGEIQQRYLSYPTVEFPIRSTRPLIEYLLEAGVLKKYDETPSATIYHDNNYAKFRRIVEDKFEVAYNNLQEKIYNFRIFELPLEYRSIQEEENEGSEQKEDKEQQHAGVL